jgi:hypothetical protein
MRFLHHTHDPFPPFPRPKDIPDLPQADAERALETLRRMTVIDLASVYTAAGSHGSRWYVWLDITGRRLTLAEWAAEWLKNHPQQQQQEGA